MSREHSKHRAVTNSAKGNTHIHPHTHVCWVQALAPESEDLHQHTQRSKASMKAVSSLLEGIYIDLLRNIHPWTFLF